MRKVIISPLIFTMCLAVTCGPQQVKRVWSEYRVDAAGDQDLIDSGGTKMCVAENGNAYVAWIDEREGTPNIYLNRKLANDDRSVGWLPDPVKVNAFSDSNVWNIDIGCNDAGVHVVWEDDRDGEVESHQIYYQRSTDNGETWQPADRLLEEDEDGRSDSFNPDILVEGPNVYVTWSDNLNGAFDIMFIRSTDSGITWQAPLRVDSDEPAGGAYSAFPRIATGFAGDNVYITWQDFRNGGASPDGGSDIYFARSVDKGLSFSADQRIDTGDDPGSADSFVPQIAADDNNVYIVWHDDRFGDSNDAMMNYSSDGGVTWGTASPADQADNRGFNQSLYPKVCTVGDVGHIVWHDNRENGFYRVFYNRAVTGLWEAPEYRLDENKVEGERGSRDTRLACDGTHILVSWLDEAADINDFGFNDIAYDYSADGGVTWLDFDIGDPTARDTYRIDSVDEGTAFKEDVNIHIEPPASPEEGAVVKAAWTDGRGGSTDIYFQQIIAGERPLVRIEVEDNGE